MRSLASLRVVVRPRMLGLSTSSTLLSSMRPALSSLLHRSLSAAAAAPATEEKKTKTPEELAARRARKKAAKERKRAAIAATGMKPSFLDPTNPLKGWIGTRGHTDTERTVDLRRFRADMAKVRVRYMDEYQEKKRIAEEAALRKRQATMLAKAERFRRRLSERLAWQEAHHEAEQVRKVERAAIDAMNEAKLREHQQKQLRKRRYQASWLRTERDAGKWVLDPSIPGARPDEFFDARVDESSFFFETVTPHGFWPDYAPNQLSSWEVPLRLDQIEAFDTSTTRFGTGNTEMRNRKKLVRQSDYEISEDLDLRGGVK